jgi:hypothetical protein
MDPKLNPNENGLIYDEWMRLVDQVLIGICGLDSTCLADGPSYDSWNDGLTPVDYAEVLLVEWNEFPADLL